MKNFVKDLGSATAIEIKAGVCKDGQVRGYVWMPQDVTAEDWGIPGNCTSMDGFAGFAEFVQSVANEMQIDAVPRSDGESEIHKIGEHFAALGLRADQMIMQRALELVGETWAKDLPALLEVTSKIERGRRR